MTSVLDGVQIVTVLTAPSVSAALVAGHALERAGITCVEVTLRTDAGRDAIAALSRETGLIVGGGTVLTAAEVAAVSAAGARFVVSPGLDEEVVEATRAAGLASLPGVATATELQRALRLGIDTVKFFPADRLGGLDTIRALAAPFPRVRFVPSGGIGDGNAAEYLRHPSIAAVSGSWVAPPSAVAAEDAGAIEKAASAAVSALVVAGITAPRRAG